MALPQGVRVAGLVAAIGLAVSCGPGTGGGETAASDDSGGAGVSTSGGGPGMTGGLDTTGDSPTETGDAPEVTTGGGLEDGSTGAAATTTTGESACAGWGPPDPCRVEGAECEFGDFCGGGLYRCEGGEWVLLDGWGCLGEAVACEEDPQPGDDCDSTEPCDPDGDCLDVLECQNWVWEEFSMCVQQLCDAANPQHGFACGGELLGVQCSVETECGPRVFQCRDEGYWDFIGPSICDDPVGCDEGPVPNDACDQAGEVCEYPNPEEPPVSCDGTEWD